MGGKVGRSRQQSTEFADLWRDQGMGVSDGQVRHEIRHVDAETYARIVRWQNDPLYEKVPYEALYEDGDPEEVDGEIIPATALDPDFDELVTVVERRDTARYRMPIVKNGRLATRTVTVRRPHSVAVPIKQSRNYRAHVRRLNGVIERPNGYELVLDELRAAITPSRLGDLPLESRGRYYRHDAQLGTPYFKRLLRYIRRLPDTERESAERVITRLTTHDDRRGRRNSRAHDPSIEAAIKADAPEARRQVKTFIGQRDAGDTKAALATLSLLCSALEQHEKKDAVDRFSVTGGPPWSYRPVGLVLWVLSKKHRVGQKRVQTLVARPAAP